jgi:hypothetical protein
MKKMRKNFSMLSLCALSAVLAIFSFSCSSMGGAKSGNEASLQPKSQEMTKALDQVYEQYNNVLDLTGAQKYTVKNGETLSIITAKFYGSSNAYFFPVIMLASQETVADPDLVVQGMELLIPDLELNLGKPDTKAKIKSFLLQIADVYQRSAAPWAEDTEKGLRDQAAKL